jgi:inosine-uridine nucleoside N-ribohydrolase
MKVIIDCDPGIDDIYALALACLNEEVEILAITIVHGNTSVENGALNTKLALKKLFPNKKHPPIIFGADLPLSGTILDLYPFFNNDGIGGVHDTLYKDEVENLKNTFLSKRSTDEPQAASKIIELVDKYPNEITIIALAPLTNLALALRMCHDPVQFTKKIKKLVIMGGNEPAGFSTEPFTDRILNYPEFNFKFDPLAAKIIMDQYLCPITIYTYDCCLRAFDVETNVLIKDFYKYIQSSKRCQFLESIGINHRIKSIIPRVFYCCDLVAMIGMFHENESKAIFKSFKNFTVRVDKSELDGLLVQRTEPIVNENIEICVTMDPNASYEIFKKYLEKLKFLEEIEK